MFKFMLLTFAFLAFAFYQLSGGSDFDPAEARQAAMTLRAERKGDPIPAEQPQIAALEETDGAPEEENEVSRVALNLTSLRAVLDEDRQPKPPILPADEIVQSGSSPAPTGQDVDSALAMALDDESYGEEPAEVVIPSMIFSGESYESSPAGYTSDSGSVREVTGSLVNVRGGPGTEFEVVGQLSRGAAVEILQDSGTGWVEMRPLDGGAPGWMADFLLGEG
ncbi:SH3 domain-containing protein [Sulfitobacter sp. LCG007]